MFVYVSHTLLNESSILLQTLYTYKNVKKNTVGVRHPVGAWVNGDYKIMLRLPILQINQSFSGSLRLMVILPFLLSLISAQDC